MTKFIAVVEYDGTAYHGWQLQKDQPTIQGTLEISLARIFGTLIRVHGAGRTDAGVHARGQVAHFTAEWLRSPKDLQKSLNSILPSDVMIRNLAVAPEDFHARHSAHSKTYIYSILNRPLKSPLDRLYAWHIPYELNLDNMKEASNFLVGTHDFAAFGSATDGTPSTVRKILKADWDFDGSSELLSFEICGTGFLRYMVRSIVGTLIFVGSGKISDSDFSKILASCDRSQSGPTAPPHGLCLQSVYY
jgi:tRNA pseudouridine38-40 synthase